MNANCKNSTACGKKNGFVDGTVAKPKEEDPEYEDWISANSMVALWILNMVDPKVRRKLANKEEPQELWKEIKDHFQKATYLVYKRLSRVGMSQIRRCKCD